MADDQSNRPIEHIQPQTLQESVLIKHMTTAHIADTLIPNAPDPAPAASAPTPAAAPTPSPQPKDK